MAGPEEDKQNQTEEPSEQKLRKARKKGDVPSSREAGNMMSILALAITASVLLPQTAPRLAGVLRRVVEIAGGVEVGTGPTGLRDLGLVLGELAGGLAVVLAPVLMVLLVCAVFGILIHGETVVAVDRIQPKLSRLSPKQGLKRIVSVDALVEFGKSVTKVAVVAIIAGFVVRDAVTPILQADRILPEAVSAHVARFVSLLLIMTVIFMVPVAIADIVWKRFSWRKKQRMSMRELKDEHKDSEGDPQIKAKREGLRRARARQRMATAVPEATVILTNPTHYAVALRYETGADPAPVCVAKGADLMAARIREIARENDVPIVENKPLARALHDIAKVDQEIPLEHWHAVAEIIGYVMDLRRNVRRKPPEGSSLRAID